MMEFWMDFLMMELGLCKFIFNWMQHLSWKFPTNYLENHENQVSELENFEYNPTENTAKYKSFCFRETFWKFLSLSCPWKSHFYEQLYLLNSDSTPAIETKAPIAQVIWNFFMGTRRCRKWFKVKNLQKLEYFWILAWKYLFASKAKV